MSSNKYNKINPNNNGIISNSNENNYNNIPNSNENNYNNILNKNISANPNKNINTNPNNISTNPNKPIYNTYKSILKDILLINFDEKKKIFKNISNTPIQTYLDEYKIENIQKYAIIVVCTQNSLSRTKDHFQHHFKEFIEKKNFTMLSKVDATRQKNISALSGVGFKRYNVRTRVYYDHNKVKLHFEPYKFKNSYTTINNEWVNNRIIVRLNRNIHSYDKINNFNKINIFSYSIHRKSRQDNKGKPIFGEGLIDVNFGFIVNHTKNNKSETLINQEKFLIIRNYSHGYFIWLRFL